MGEPHIAFLKTIAEQQQRFRLQQVAYGRSDGTAICVSDASLERVRHAAQKIRIRVHACRDSDSAPQTGCAIRLKLL